MSRRLTLTLLLFTLSIGLLGCPERKSIADVLRSPGRYAEDDVTVAGRVVKSYGALGTGIYQIDDDTGQLWIFSEKEAVPGQGEKVAVTGRITPTVTYAGKSFATVLREKERHYKR